MFSTGCSWKLFEDNRPYPIPEAACAPGSGSSGTGKAGLHMIEPVISGQWRRLAGNTRRYGNRLTTLNIKHPG